MTAALFSAHFSRIHSTQAFQNKNTMTAVLTSKHVLDVQETKISIPIKTNNKKDVQRKKKGVNLILVTHPHPPFALPMRASEFKPFGRIF
jgi:hypothetical protein